MPANSTNDIQQRASRWIGILYLPSFVVVLATNMGVLQSLIVPGDPGGTARNILAHEGLFRLALIGNAAYVIAVFVIAVAYHALLKPYNAMQAQWVLLGRTLFGAVWTLTLVNQFSALRLTTRPEYASIMGSEEWALWVRFYLSGYDQYYVGLLFWSLAATASARLLIRSGLIPKSLARFGVAASVWCVFCTLAHYVDGRFSTVVNLWWYDLPMVIFEIVTSFFLLAFGVRTRVDRSGPEQ